MEKRVFSNDLATNNAIFSLNMEGFSVDDDCKALCEKLLNREITFEDYLKEVIRLQGLDK